MKGDQLQSEEAPATKEEELPEEEAAQSEPKKDKLLEALLRMMQLGSKQDANAKEGSDNTGDASVTEKSASKDSSVFENTDDKSTVKDSEDKSTIKYSDDGIPKLSEKPSSKLNAADEMAESSTGTVSGDKVKVRVTRLDGGDLKILEENEKQEELAGTATDASKLNSAAKKIETMIKNKLEKAGVDIGGLFIIIRLFLSDAL